MERRAALASGSAAPLGIGEGQPESGDAPSSGGQVGVGSWKIRRVGLNATLREIQGERETARLMWGMMVQPSTKF